MNTPELETERLRLRRFTAEDAAAILAIFGDVEANTFLPWFPLKSLEEARQLFERQYQPVYRAEQGIPIRDLPQGGRHPHRLRQGGPGREPRLGLWAAP